MVITPSSQGEDRIRKVSAAVEPGAKIVAAKRPSVPDNATALPKAKLQVLSGAFAGRELELNQGTHHVGRPGVQVAAITRRAERLFHRGTSTAARKTTIRRSTAYRSTAGPSAQ